MMTSQKRITLIGNTPSPYTKKMVALLRYRQIPYSIVWANPADVLETRGMAAPKVALLPTFIFDDAQGLPQAVVDSTPIIRTLESMYEPRSVIPINPVLAFIDYLLEDFADEWCTKYMFHYRWHFRSDADNAGTLLPFCIDPSMDVAKHAHAKEFFSKRQIERLYVVGSNDVTAPIIDASYKRFLKALEAHFEQQLFLLGNRPGAADFALYGQLSQLIGFDPTPRKIAHELSPRTVAWSLMADDLSGLEVRPDHWNDIDSIPGTLSEILKEVGRVYAPALLANAKALESGQKEWETNIDGAQWRQQTFAYQGKCLHWINQQYHALASSDKERVNVILAGTGWDSLIIQQ